MERGNRPWPGPRDTGHGVVGSAGAAQQNRGVLAVSWLWVAVTVVVAVAIVEYSSRQSCRRRVLRRIYITRNLLRTSPRPTKVGWSCMLLYMLYVDVLLVDHMWQSFNCRVLRLTAVRDRWAVSTSSKEGSATVPGQYSWRPNEANFLLYILFSWRIGSPATTGIGCVKGDQYGQMRLLGGETGMFLNVKQQQQQRRRLACWVEDLMAEEERAPQPAGKRCHEKGKSPGVCREPLWAGNGVEAFCVVSQPSYT